MGRELATLDPSMDFRWEAHGFRDVQFVAQPEVPSGISCPDVTHAPSIPIVSLQPLGYLVVRVANVLQHTAVPAARSFSIVKGAGFNSDSVAVAVETLWGNDS